MVNIPPIKMVRTGGWFMAYMALFYPHSLGTPKFHGNLLFGVFLWGEFFWPLILRGSIGKSADSAGEGGETDPWSLGFQPQKSDLHCTKSKGFNLVKWQNLGLIGCGVHVFPLSVNHLRHDDQLAGLGKPPRRMYRQCGGGLLRRERDWRSGRGWASCFCFVFVTCEVEVVIELTEGFGCRGFGWDIVGVL